MTFLALSRLDKADRPIVIASLFVLAILALGSVYTLATQGTLAFLRPELDVGAAVTIDQRGTAAPGAVVPTPFVPATAAA